MLSFQSNYAVTILALYGFLQPHFMCNDIMLILKLSPTITVVQYILAIRVYLQSKLNPISFEIHHIYVNI